MDFIGKRVDAITSTASFVFFEGDAIKMQDELRLGATPKLAALAKLQGDEALEIDADRHPPAQGDALFYVGGYSEPISSIPMCKEAVKWARKLGHEFAGMAIEGAYSAIAVSGSEPEEALATKLDAGWRAQMKANEGRIALHAEVLDAGQAAPTAAMDIFSKLSARRVVESQVPTFESQPKF